MNRAGLGLLAVLLLGSVAAVGVAGAADATPSTDELATVQSNGSQEWLPERRVEVVHGNTTRFEVTLPGDAAGPLTIDIGGEDREYDLVATVRDADGDGTIGLEYSAGVAGATSSSLTAVGEDAVTVRERTALARDGWDARAFDITLRTGTSPDGERLDGGSLGVVFDATHIDMSDDSSDDESTAENRSDGDRDRSSTGDDWFSAATPAADVDETATIRVNLRPEANGSVTLNIGERNGYHLAATLYDRDGDGVIRADFDVSAAGTDRNPLTVDGTDEGVVHRQTDRPDGGLAPGNYEMNLTLGRPPAGEEVAIGTLIVNSRDNDPDGTSATEKAAETGDDWNWGNRNSVIANGGIATVRAGQVAHVPVQVRPGTAVTLRIQRPGTPDDYVVAVEDTDGSGRVPLLFRTGAVDAGSHRVATRGDNDVRLLDGASDTDAIAAGLVSIDVYNGSGLRTDGDGIRNEHLGVGTLQLLEANGTSNGSTATPTPGSSVDDDGTNSDVGALATIAVGGFLAVVGVAVLFGFRRW